MTHWRVGLALCALASLPVMTAQRVTLWQVEGRVWAEAAQQAPTQVKARLNVGYHAHVSGQRRQAEEAYRQALMLADLRRDQVGCRIAAYNLGVLARDEGRWQEVMRWGEYPCHERPR